jgi:hypothetical protein
VDATGSKEVMGFYMMNFTENQDVMGVTIPPIKSRYKWITTFMSWGLEDFVLRMDGWTAFVDLRWVV